MAVDNRQLPSPTSMNTPVRKRTRRLLEPLPRVEDRTGASPKLAPASSFLEKLEMAVLRGVLIFIGTSILLLAFVHPSKLVPIASTFAAAPTGWLLSSSAYQKIFGGDKL